MDSTYEAVIDPEGYAVPSQFMKLPRKRADSAVQYDDYVGDVIYLLNCSQTVLKKKMIQ